MTRIFPDFKIREFLKEVTARSGRLFLLFTCLALLYSLDPGSRNFIRISADSLLNATELMVLMLVFSYAGWRLMKRKIPW